MSDTEPIPDIWSALKGGRYPFDLIREVVGTESVQRSRRLDILNQLLLEENGPEAVANLWIVGMRRSLDLVNAGHPSEKPDPHFVRRCVTNLTKASTDAARDALARNPTEITKP